MVLEILMYFERPLSEFWYHFPISFSFPSHFSIFCTLFIEENALNNVRLV